MHEPGACDVYTSLSALVRLRFAARGFSYLPRQPVRSILNGRKRSRLRGRGLDFEELRHYRPGDDIRTMDWRVTNRTGKPHVRVYTEERDRPVVALVDQRMPMFFGSKKKMKSVIAAELAALTAWQVLSAGDRIGAILFNDETIIEARPTKTERKLIGWLGSLTEMNQSLSVNTGNRCNPETLTKALEKLERSIGHDYLVVLVSDFYGWSDESLKSIRRINQHNDVICSIIYDPLERDITRADELVVSDGLYQLEIDPRSKNLGARFEARFDHSMARVQEAMQRYGIPVLSVETITPVSQQLREKLGGQRILQ